MMHRNRARPFLATWWRYVSTTAAVSVLLASAPTLVHAQMGGMGGAGGMGRGDMRGGRGAAPAAGNRRSPADMARERLKAANPLEFLLEHKKPLALSKAQQDSIKHYRKDVEQMQKPLFAALDDAMRSGTSAGGQRGAGGRPVGGMRNGGASSGRMGDGDPEVEMADRWLPDTARTLLKRLEDIQQAFGERARAQLHSNQLVRADSIQAVKLEEQRAKAARSTTRAPLPSNRETPPCDLSAAAPPA
ncbi:hypothetical protein [Gemmatimonas sp.]